MARPTCSSIYLPHSGSLLEIIMAYGFGPRLIASTERKFGHLAIPNLLHWVAGFQFLVFVISVIDPNYMSLLAFDRDAIFSGQVWRLVSYLFFPQTSSMFWILISVFFLWFISNGLESAWGSFRVNLYLCAILFCLTSVGLIAPRLVGNGGLFSILVFANLFFAFASHYPNQQIMLMMIIPIKVKYLAWVNAAYLLMFFLAAPVLGFIIPLGLVPYLVVFGPDFIRNWRQRGVAAGRRSRFQADSLGSDGQAFHTCSICGIDDIADPSIEFRVASDGDEFCLPCLTSKQQEGQADSTSS